MTLENRRLFKDVIRLEKLATVGQVTSGIAHEVKNQLSVLMGMQIVRNKYPNDEMIQNLAELMNRARDRIVNLIDEVRSYSRQTGEALNRTPVDLRHLLDETIQMVALDPDFKKVEYDVQCEAEQTLNCDAGRMLQVLVNLVRNAGQAMKGTGTVVLGGGKRNGGIEIQVIDQGCGIPEENLEKIWEPFFTTKGDQGTGLGLQICKRIVEAHGGTLQCQSRFQEGTTFSIILP